MSILYVFINNHNMKEILISKYYIYREMNLVTRMLDQNPWWREPDMINDDKKIKEWKGTIQYTSKLISTIKYNFAPDNTVVYTLRGPRQIGKTTLIKLQIKQLLDDGAPPLHIMYYTLDLARGPEDVVDVIETYMKYAERRRGKSRCYVFLDEISSVPNWQKGIKWLVDVGRLWNTTVLVTGSHTLDIKSASERLPGRRGIVKNGHDKMLLPMSFREYVLALNPDLGGLIEECTPTLESKKSLLRNMAENEIDDTLYRLFLYQKDLNNLLDEYMVTGGIPKIVSKYAQSSTLADPDYETYLHALTGEWSRIHKNTSLLNQLGRRLVLSMGNRISWSRLAKMAGLSGPGIAADYADTLERLFMLVVVYKFDEQNPRTLTSADKKIYFADPYIFHMFRTWTGISPMLDSSIKFLDDAENKGRVLESVVANHLIRLAFELTMKKSTFEHHDHVFYWIDKKRREVDFVMDDRSGIRMAIEVKLGGVARDVAGLRTLMNMTKIGGVVLSDNDLEKGDHLVVPASVFLSLV